VIKHGDGQEYKVKEYRQRIHEGELEGDEVVWEDLPRIPDTDEMFNMYRR